MRFAKFLKCFKGNSIKDLEIFKLLCSVVYLARIGMSMTYALIKFNLKSISDSKKYLWLILFKGKRTNASLLIIVNPLLGSNMFQYPVENFAKKDKNRLPNTLIFGIEDKFSRFANLFPLA
jgi:hypothetical protein